MIALRSCWPSRVNCIVHQHGGIHSSNESSRKDYAFGKSLALSKQLSNLGSKVEATGKAIQSSTFRTSSPGKTWTKLTRRQHAHEIAKGGSRMSSIPVSSKKFDYKPARSTRAQERHFARGMGYDMNRERKFRNRRLLQGGLVRGVGRAIPVIGWAWYAYEVSRADKPLEMVGKDALATFAKRRLNVYSALLGGNTLPDDPEPSFVIRSTSLSAGVKSRMNSSPGISSR